MSSDNLGLDCAPPQPISNGDVPASQGIGRAGNGCITLELEAKRLGTLDVKALIKLLMLSDQHIDTSVDEENARTE